MYLNCIKRKNSKSSDVPSFTENNYSVLKSFFFIFLFILKDNPFTPVSENVSIQQSHVVTNTILYVFMIKR